MSYKYEIKKGLIDYLRAENGGIRFITNKETFYGRTVQECADIIAEQGLADRVSGSSSMDFASEHGFDTDDGAINLYVEAIKLSGRYVI
mgnify:CR=1 FL=1